MTHLSGNDIHLNSDSDFRHYYVTLYPELRFFVRKYINDAEDADDLIQDLWLRIWTQKPHFENDYALKAYLYKGLRNAILNYLRDKKRHPDSCELNEEWENESGNMLNEMIEAELKAAINDTFEQLSPVCKSVYMQSLAGKSQKEIAEDMNITVNTVKKHINNANHFIRKRMEKVMGVLVLLMV